MLLESKRIDLDEKPAFFDPEAVVTYSELGRKGGFIAKYIA